MTLPPLLACAGPAAWEPSAGWTPGWFAHFRYFTLGLVLLFHLGARSATGVSWAGRGGGAGGGAKGHRVTVTLSPCKSSAQSKAR